MWAAVYVFVRYSYLLLVRTCIIPGTRYQVIMSVGFRIEPFEKYEVPGASHFLEGPRSPWTWHID